MSDDDSRLLRRATRRVAVQTGAAVAVVVAVVVGLVYLTSLEARRDATESKAQGKVAAALAAGEAGSVVADGLPSECPESEVDAAADGLGVGETWFEVCGGPFLGYVEEADGARTAAVVSFVEQRDETRRLAQLSLFAGLVGVLAAAALGWVSARRAVRPLGAALSLQRRFVADASHELRTPLAILQTRAQMLARTTPAEDPQHEELRLLVQDARVMGDVVDDLLLVTRLRDRRPTYEAVDLVAVARAVRDAFAATAADAGVDLRVEAEDRVVEVAGAPVALRRAVTALVDNALAHVSAGGSVRLRVVVDADGARLAVLDDGTGLDPAEADHLTRRFARGLVPDGEGEHRLGLGLALVREIVEAHDGGLEIDGSPEGGAAVTLRLPRARGGPDPVG
ncbi:hypothetical protein GCM10009737_13220 [Nocardioides lentus]|uniref:Sensor-like histidine kinase SenX3 n=1 Tax=Nocardioides lentus TaxID=338077 RepID=A0ABN2P643_9ACTN